ANVFDVLWTTRQHLRDHQIFRTDYGDRRASNVDGNRPLKEVLLQSWTGENDIDGHARLPMHERKHSRAGHEIGVSKDEIETARSHHLHESVDRVRPSRPRAPGGAQRR